MSLNPTLYQLEQEITLRLATLAGVEANMASRTLYGLKSEQNRLLGLLELGGGSGTPGKSAYQLAQDEGYTGTLEEWLESLVGPPGADGQDGEDGQDGQDGNSATRQTLTHTTASLAPSASETFQLTTPRSFTAYTLSVSVQARTRAYGTSAARTADEARAFGAEPIDAVYPALDFDSNLPHKGSLVGKLYSDFSPNAEGTWFMRVTNTGSSASAITLEIAVLPREAVS